MPSPIDGGERPDRLARLGARAAQRVDQPADRHGREDLGHGGAEHQAAGQGHGSRVLPPLRYGKGQHVVEADVHDRLEQQEWAARPAWVGLGQDQWRGRQRPECIA